MSDLSNDPDAVVRAFCGCWGRRDLDEMMSYFAPDAVYQNMPMEPNVGADAIREFLVTFLEMASDLDFVIHHQVASGTLVMNERTDTMTLADKTVALPVAGVFEVIDGKIAAWRDYFDMTAFLGM